MLSLVKLLLFPKYIMSACITFRGRINSFGPNLYTGHERKENYHQNYNASTLIHLILPTNFTVTSTVEPC